MFNRKNSPVQSATQSDDRPSIPNRIIGNVGCAAFIAWDRTLNKGQLTKKTK